MWGCGVEVRLGFFEGAVHIVVWVVERLMMLFQVGFCLEVSAVIGQQH